MDAGDGGGQRGMKYSHENSAVLVTKSFSKKWSEVECSICSMSPSGADFCFCAGCSRKSATGFRNSEFAQVSQHEGERSMDYIIAGVASLGLFIYLIYALLRREKF